MKYERTQSSACSTKYNAHTFTRCCIYTVCTNKSARIDLQCQWPMAAKIRETVLRCTAWPERNCEHRRLDVYTVSPPVYSPSRAISVCDRPSGRHARETRYERHGTTRRGCYASNVAFLDNRKPRESRQSRSQYFVFNPLLRRRSTLRSKIKTKSNFSLSVSLLRSAKNVIWNFVELPRERRWR